MITLIIEVWLALDLLLVVFMWKIKH